MTATNHGLAGALIGAVMPLPIAIPVAFISHFMLDALPHYGIPHKQRDGAKTYRLIVYGDTIIALLIAASVILFSKWNMLITGLVAYSPDATWVFHYYKQGKSLHIQPKNWFMKFHRAIQQFERPWGIWVELSAFAAMLPLFVDQLLK